MIMEQFLNTVWIAYEYQKWFETYFDNQKYDKLTLPIRILDYLTNKYKGFAGVLNANYIIDELYEYFNKKYNKKTIKDVLVKLDNDNKESLFRTHQIKYRMHSKKLYCDF